MLTWLGYARPQIRLGLAHIVRQTHSLRGSRSQMHVADACKCLSPLARCDRFGVRDLDSKSF
ncbi:MAG: hypothetical protein NPIRA06_08800 [Nitrospirales bacterium]|nr:MAG: hypothetical protein NPIRA06_08800 [Nitrospirales bacterium]